MLAASIPFVVAQQDCLDGIINGKFGLNATITLCPKFASQVPELQRQLTEIAKPQGEQKEQMRELKPLINGVNGVSQNIGQQRQFELLKNLSAQIEQQQAAGQQQTQERIADLADQLDDLKDLLITKLGNASTRDRTTTAVDGPVGDAIAKFDLAKAHDLLEDIRAQLNVIRNEVSKVRSVVEKESGQIGNIAEDVKKTKQETSSDPRKELSNMGVAWSLKNYQDATQMGDLRTINLFLAGGFSPNQRNILDNAFVLTQAVGLRVPNLREVIELFKRYGLSFKAPIHNPPNPYRNGTIEAEMYKYPRAFISHCARKMIVRLRGSSARRECCEGLRNEGADPSHFIQDFVALRRLDWIITPFRDVTLISSAREDSGAVVGRI
jgi:hypothetical protein